MLRPTGHPSVLTIKTSHQHGGFKKTSALGQLCPAARKYTPHQKKTRHCLQGTPLHQLLSSTLMPHNWDMVDNWTMAQVHTIQAATTSKQKWKFEHLHATQHPVDQMDTSKVVINLSDKALKPAATSILSKSNMKDFVSGIEQAIHHLPTETAKEIQQETSWIIRHAKPHHRRTTPREWNMRPC
jgi:hypothetical protein